MTKEVWLLDEIEVEVTGFFTTHHRFRSRSGAGGELTVPAFGRQATFRTSGGRELLMYRTGWLSSAYELAEGAVVRGRADRRGLLRRDMVVQFDDREFSLQPDGFFKRGWTLFDAGGNAVLQLQPRGVLKCGAYLSVPSAIDADLVAFAYYLVHQRRQEEAAAGAAAAS